MGDIWPADSRRPWESRIRYKRLIVFSLDFGTQKLKIYKQMIQILPLECMNIPQTHDNEVCGSEDRNSDCEDAWGGVQMPGGRGNNAKPCMNSPPVP